MAGVISNKEDRMRTFPQGESFKMLLQSFINVITELIQQIRENSLV